MCIFFNYFELSVSKKLHGFIFHLDLEQQEISSFLNNTRKKHIKPVPWTKIEKQPLKYAAQAARQQWGGECIGPLTEALHPLSIMVNWRKSPRASYTNVQPALCAQQMGSGSELSCWSLDLKDAHRLCAT